MNGGDKQPQPNSAPTGCYKCGRPGHWSRDCPDQNPDPTSPPNKPFNNNNNKGAASQAEKPKRVLKTRPKLTPELLLSDDGIGFVLRHFPTAFKYHGRGHEVSDLGNLIGLYAQWHSHLIPYYSFDQFVNKVEQVGTTRHVKLCLRGLRDKVANGGDLTKLHEAPVEDNSNGKEEAMNVEEPNTVHEHVFSENHDADFLQDDIFQELNNQAREEPNPSNLDNLDVTDTTTGLSQSHNISSKDSTDETGETVENTSNKAKQKPLSDEQKARMEVNRLKAMEKAAARARSIA